MPFDRLVAGVGAELLDTLLPVLAEEVVVALGAPVPRDLTPVRVALLGLRSVDDPTVERAVRGALGLPIGVTTMAAPPRKGAPLGAMAARQRAAGAAPPPPPPGAPAAAVPPPAPPPPPPPPAPAPPAPAPGGAWYADCPPAAAQPLANFVTPPFGGDVIPLIHGALQVDFGRLHAEAILTLAQHVKDGRFDVEFAWCDQALREDLARRVLCLEEDAQWYASTLADRVTVEVLARGRPGPVSTVMRRLERDTGRAVDTGENRHWQVAALTAAEAHRVIAGRVIIKHHIDVNAGLAVLDRMRETLALVGDDLEVLPTWTTHDGSYVYDRLADHEATVALLEFVRSGGADQVMAERARRLFARKSA